MYKQPVLLVCAAYYPKGYIHVNQGIDMLTGAGDIDT